MWCSQAKKCFPLAHSSQRWPVLSLGPRSPASRSPWSKGWHLSLKTQNIPSQREGGAAMVPGLPPARQTTLVLCRVKLKVGFSRPVRAVLTLAMCPLRSPRPPEISANPCSVGWKGWSLVRQTPQFVSRQFRSLSRLSRKSGNKEMVRHGQEWGHSCPTLSGSKLLAASQCKGWGINQKASGLPFQLNSFSLSLRSYARTSNWTFRFLLPPNVLHFEEESEPSA